MRWKRLAATKMGNLLCESDFLKIHCKDGTRIDDCEETVKEEENPEDKGNEPTTDEMLDSNQITKRVIQVWFQNEKNKRKIICKRQSIISLGHSVFSPMVSGLSYNHSQNLTVYHKNTQ